MPNLKYLTHMYTLITCLVLTACGGGGDSKSSDGAKVSTMQNVETIQSVETVQTPEQELNTEIRSSSSASSPVIQEAVVPSSMQLSGTITYDRILFGEALFRGLDYDTTIAMPSRGVTVQVINASGTVLDFTQTNALGQYQFTVTKNTQLRIRVMAELSGQSPADWSMQVKDNTNRDALYVLDGSLISSGDSATQSRNLHAESGWDGNDYNQTRSAAPFAILDSLYDAVQTIVTASPNTILPPLDIYWSEDNIAIGGSLSEGKIGTSFYTSDGPAIYLLGAKNNDSDEYDRAVIQHEFGHYVEHQLSRTESIGGSHNVNSLLDLRVAFGEAWGNAFAGMVSGDPLYRDSLGSGQSLGFSINVQKKNSGAQGWFSEGSIQSILYNLFDDDNSGSDSISLGFKPIFDVLTSDTYLDHAGFASIYPFIEVLKQQNPSIASEITELLTNYSVFGTGFYGEGESNAGGSLVTLPIYSDLIVGQTIEVCSDSAFQNFNGLDVYRHIKIDIPSNGSYTVSASNSNGSLFSRSNPQIRIYQKGNLKATSTDSTNDRETLTTNLSEGTYIVEVYEQSNATNDNNSGGSACFNVTLN